MASDSLKRLAGDLIAEYERCEVLGGWGNVRHSAFNLATALHEAGGGADEETCRRCFAEHVATAENQRPALEVARRLAGASEDEYKTAKWFKQETGIDPSRLRKAASRGALPTRGAGKQKQYHVPTAKQLWPEDFAGIPA